MKAIDVANIITTYFDNGGELITNKRLQKLLYYVEAWNLVYDKSLIDEDFEAWVHGPVIPSVYQQFKQFGYAPIVNKYSKGESSSTKLEKLLKNPALKSKSKDILFSVLDDYAQYNSFQLEWLSHSEKPWLEAREGVGMLDHCSNIISKETMKEYYSSLLNDKK